ncbi:hypothetical protein CS0771_06760 [Catellatospora sp. IY07-71]|uniref:hypothetical protein n=1 Tax=Catellatospora sp. IY07-71 TaxID=2728827 RepID=UPI001BB30CB4|nr:hypothetical protein [Catellatospora sp. IY07-71]BCJ71132.1 hypothetical protein CS0771_06760 [Catellatospora sp. IY07-71]
MRTTSHHRLPIAATLLALLAAAASGCSAQGPAEPQAGASTSTPAPAASATPAASPTASPAAGSGPAAGVTAIPDAAFLTPADLGPGYRALGADYLGETYGFAIEYCVRNGQWDRKPSGPTEQMSAKNARRLVLAAPSGSQTVQYLNGYQSETSARQAMAHERTGFERCTEIDLGQTTHTFTILATGFAGDESMLVKDGKRDLLVFVRAGAVFTWMQVGQEFDTDPAAAKDLARKAVQRICAATPTC